MKSLSSKTYQCGVTIQGLTTLSGTVYLTGITNTASWDHVIVGTTAQGQIYTRTYAQFMGDVATGISLSSYVTGSGTTNYLPKFTGGSALGNSQIFDNGTDVGVGTSSPFVKFDVRGEAILLYRPAANAYAIYSAANNSYSWQFGIDNGSDYVIWGGGFTGLGTERFRIASTGAATFSSTIQTNANAAFGQGIESTVRLVAASSGNTNGTIALAARNLAGTMGFAIYGDLTGYFGGNVGIGTTTPATKFVVSNAGVSGFEVDPTGGVSSGVLLQAYNRSTSAYMAQSYYALTHTFNVGSGAGTRILDITSTGNVGIATTIPGSRLQVTATSNSATTVDNGITILNDSGVNNCLAGIRLSTYGDSDGGLYPKQFIGAIRDGAFGAGKGSIVFCNRDAADTSVVTLSDEKMRILPSGNVGIGTTTPTYKLSVLTTGTGGFSLNTYNSTVGGPQIDLYDSTRSQETVISSTDGTTTGTYLASYSNHPLLFGTYAASTPTAKMAILPSGNVGIGTNAPVGILHLYKSAAATRLAIDGDAGQNRLISYRTGAVQRFGLYVNNTAESGSNAGSNFAIRAYNDAGTLLSTPFFINRASGNVGIGTTSPNTWKLSVDSSTIYAASFDTSNNVGVVINGNDTTASQIIGFSESASTYNALHLRTNSTSTSGLYINTSGNVGIGTTSPSQKLHVVGASILANNSSINPDSYSNTVIAGAIGTVGGWALSSAIGGNAGTGHSWAIGTNGDNLYMGYSDGSSSNSMLTFLQVDDNTRNVFLVPSAGNVGIGTASPSYKLDVNGSIRTSGVGGLYIDASANFGDNSGANFDILNLGSTRALRILGTSNGGWGNILLNPYGANVGIGTTVPTNRLQIGSIGSSGYGGNDLAIGNGTQVMAFYQSATVSTWYTNTSFSLMPSGSGSVGYVGIGTLTPSTLLDVSGVITATGGNSTNWNTAYGWGNHASANYVPQARTLTINGTSYDLSANRSWTIATTTPGGSDTQVQYNSSGSLAGASALTYNSTTNRVGINQAFPGYDLDVNGQVRVQDKLRIGTGNGVVHMSSTATINASATTVVWAQTVSVGMCAFIEYYILNNNSLTDQRAGTIMVTWNQSGTPTIAHTETTTPDIGSTTTVNFTSSLVGSDARINAVNSSANPYTMVMSYKYF